MSVPFFSICIPTCNRRLLLAETLRYAVCQTFKNIEILVFDNASVDGTHEEVKQVDDPRIKYVRHEQNLGAAANFQLVANAAAGHYVIINQDDDLLHHQFLERCHHALQKEEGISMYAAPVWRQNHGRGYQARLLRHHGGYDHEYLLSDQPIRMPGPQMAVSMLNLEYYFLHPTVIMNREKLVAIGGYVRQDDALADIITEAKLLMHGDLLYDPRPAGMFREHSQNEWKKYSRASKKRFMARTLEEIISECNKAGLPWEQLLREEMQNWSRGDLWRAINEWTFCGAPKTLIYNAMDRLRIWDGGHFKNGLKIMRKLGFNCFLKYYFDHYKTRRL